MSLFEVEDLQKLLDDALERSIGNALRAERLARERDALIERLWAARTAPVQPSRGIPFPTRVPWVMHERAWSQYAAAGHGNQSAERMAERGGFGVKEFVVCCLGRDYNRDSSYDLTPEDIASVRDEAEGLLALTDAVARDVREQCAADAERLAVEYAGDGCTVEDAMRTFARWLRAQS